MNRAYAVVSGVLLAAAFPPYSAWPAGLVALYPLWRGVRRARTLREATDLGALAGFAFAALALPWLTKVFSWWAVGLWAFFALGPALHAYLIKRLQRSNDWVWVVSTAVLWVGLEAARARLPGLACPWLSLGYALSPCAPLLQLASLVGLYGLSALLAASSAALALAAEGRRVPALVLTGVLGVAWAWGERRMEAPLEGVPVSAALVQDESYDVERLAALTPKDADLVVWPEYQVGVPAGVEARFREHVARLTAGRSGVLVAGAATVDEDAPFENFAWVLAKDGSLLGRHDKQHPIPFMERRLKGHSDPRPVMTALGPLGVQICYDLDFEDGARVLARRGARLLAVPNLDPKEWGPAQHAQHAAMAPLRAVETGLWVAKAASSGESMLIDPRGRVTARLGYGRSGTVSGQARLSESRTPYVLWGWLFAPLALLALGVAVVLALKDTFRRRALEAYPAAAPSPGPAPRRSAPAPGARGR